MKSLFGKILKAVGIGGLVGVGTSAAASGAGLVDSLSGFVNTAILVCAAVVLIWLMFKFIKK